MTKRILTHPDNTQAIIDLFQKELEKEIFTSSDHLHFITHDVKKLLNIQENKYMEKERWTGKWRVKENRFYSYWDGVGEPPSWCIYFGYVEKVMEPNLYKFEEPILSWDLGRKSNRYIYHDFGNYHYKPKALLMNYSV